MGGGANLHLAPLTGNTNFNAEVSRAGSEMGTELVDVDLPSWMMMPEVVTGRAE